MVLFREVQARSFLLPLLEALSRKEPGHTGGRRARLGEAGLLQSKAGPMSSRPSVLFCVRTRWIHSAPTRSVLGTRRGNLGPQIDLFVCKNSFLFFSKNGGL